MSYEKAALVTIEDLYHELETGPNGLSDQEARLRLQKFGYNVLPTGKKINLPRRFLIQFKNIFNILLLIASFLSFVSGLFFNDAGSIQMGLAIIVVVFLNAIFSLFQEYRAEKAAQVIRSFIPRKAKVSRDGQLKEVDVTDIVLLDNDFTSIIEGVRLGRSMFDNLRKFIYYVFTHNWAELLAFIVFILIQSPLPLLVIQVLAIDLMMDVFPSLSLIMEPPEPEVMKKPPRKSGTRLINFSTLLRSCYVGVIVSACAIFWAFNVWRSGGWTLGNNETLDPMLYARGTTIVMAGIMIGQLGNFFASRTDIKSAFTLNPLRNQWLFPAIFAEFCIMIAVIYLPFLQHLFRTAPLLSLDWLFLLTLAPAALLLEEMRKLLVRRIRS